VNTISTTVREALVGKPKAWEPPQFDMPILLAERELEDYLGDLGGSRWYRVKRWGGAELAEGQRKGDRDTLPDGPVLQVVDENGRTAWRTFHVHEPGTYQRLVSTPLRAPKPPEPFRGLDAVAATFLGAPRPEKILSLPARGDFPNPLSRAVPAPIVKPAEPAAGGVEMIIERLKAAGTVVRLSDDRQYIVPTSRGGRPGPGVVELLLTAGPLILAYLRGGPLLCVVGPHRPGDDPQATTLLAGGCPSCARHVAEPEEAAQ
jgi:hypothetical protein